MSVVVEFFHHRTGYLADGGVDLRFVDFVVVKLSRENCDGKC